MIKAWLKHFEAHSERMNQRMERRARLETLGDVTFWVLAFGLFWTFAWNAHIIGPWVDSLMGWGPHDIDSEGKIRWRRIWSTAICLPGIVFSVLLYLRNLRNRK